MGIDKAGNVIGVRPGKSAHPNLVFSAHLDTVFPEGTDVKVTRTGDLMKGPGIGDDCRGLALMLGLIRALDEGHVQTPGTITFVADVGEEGLGDLRGMKSLFFDSLKGQIDKFISVDGTGNVLVDGVLTGPNSSVANGKIREQTPFEDVYIQPASGDNGTALGAAGALTGPALLDWAKAWAQSAPWCGSRSSATTARR